MKVYFCGKELLFHLENPYIGIALNAYFRIALKNTQPVSFYDIDLKLLIVNAKLMESKK